MSDKDARRKMRRLVELANELDAEAKERYGRQGFLFFESEGSFNMMDGDSDGHVAERQLHVRMSVGGCRMGCGSW